MVNTLSVACCWHCLAGFNPRCIFAVYCHTWLILWMSPQSGLRRVVISTWLRRRLIHVLVRHAYIGYRMSEDIFQSVICLCALFGWRIVWSVFSALTLNATGLHCSVGHFRNCVFTACFSAELCNFLLLPIVLLCTILLDGFVLWY